MRLMNRSCKRSPRYCGFRSNSSTDSRSVRLKCCKVAAVLPIEAYELPSPCDVLHLESEPRLEDVGGFLETMAARRLVLK